MAQAVTVGMPDTYHVYGQPGACKSIYRASVLIEWAACLYFQSFFL